MKKFIWITLAILVLLLTLAAGYYLFVNKEEPKKITSVNEEKTTKAVTYLMIDINPSIELLLDEDNKVIDVVTLNEDADIAYNDLSIIGQSVTDATNNIINAAVEMGYINEIDEDQEVNLTVTSDITTKETEVIDLVNNAVASNIDRKLLPVLIIKNKMTDEVKATADGYQISYGKMLLIRRAMTLDNTLIETDLVPLSIKEIQTKIKASVKLRIEAKKAELGENGLTYRLLKEQRIAEMKKMIEAKKAAVYNNYAKNRTLTEAEKQEIIRNRKVEIRTKIAQLKRSRVQ